MRQIRWILRIVGKNWKAFVGFEILFKIISSTAIMPLFGILFDQSLRLSGLRYLTAENLHRFLRSPLPFICFILIGLLYALLSFFEIGVLICLLDHCRHGRKATIGQALIWSLKSCRRLFTTPHNFRILPALLILSPFFHFATLINMFWSYSVSERLIRFISRRWYRAAGFFILLFLFFLLFLRWMFVCHYFQLDGCSGKKAFRNSINLGRKTHILRSFIPVVYSQVILTFFYVLLLCAGLFVCDLARNLFRLSGAGVSSFQVIAVDIGVSAFDAFILIVTYAGISDLFYKGKHKLHENIPFVRLTDDDDPLLRTKRSRLAERILYIVSALMLVFYFAFVSRSTFRLRVHGLQNMEVTAHRGASMFYPENTMPAFYGALEQGADWIELDVQESADGMIYIMHDTSLERTTGMTQSAWETDWKTIQTLDAGSWFSQDFAGTPVCLLQDVIDMAKQTGIRLNIEIKPSGYEKNLTESVVAIIEENDFKNQSVITSQSYDVVRRVKELDEEIYTVYVMGLAYGAINRLKDADAFSIRSTSISRSLVKDLHNRGLEVYAWTVDSRHNINRMIDFGVDNIITNNIPLARECINNSRTNSMLLERIKMLTELF